MRFPSHGLPLPSWPMGLRLSVREAAWRHSIESVAADMPGLIPVVKGNGYGFGRSTLMPIAVALADRIAVGTVYEAGDVPNDRVGLVLTPHIDRLPDDLAATVVLTVGNIAHVNALSTQGRIGPVAIKLQSSMRRYGASPDELPALIARVGSAGLTVDSFALHLPLVGGPTDRLAEIEEWLPHLDPTVPIAISHVDTSTFDRIRRSHPSRTWSVRVGTALWHADKSLLHLTADVLEVRAVGKGDRVGYRGSDVHADGRVILVAAGSAHGVRALDEGLSPFHFQRRRLTMLEPPHMHTSMVFVPASDPCPIIGDRVDVQRPLISTAIDELEWVRD